MNEQYKMAGLAEQARCASPRACPSRIVLLALPVPASVVHAHGTRARVNTLSDCSCAVACALHACGVT